MIHVVFNRPSASFKVFGLNGAIEAQFVAGGDAWGGPGYGHDGPTPVGHYLLTHVEKFDAPIASEGDGQVYVADLDFATVRTLENAGKARIAVFSYEPGAVDTQVEIGGITLPIGQLAKYDRSAIMIHGGGSNAPDPLAPQQPLLRTEGCTRLHNEDFDAFASWLAPLLADNVAVYSVIGEPLPLPD